MPSGVFLFIQVGNLKPGSLFIAIGKSNALTTDPWSLTDRTITFADHTTINIDQMAMLVECHDMIDSKIFIWLLEDRIVWQILRNEAYIECWKPIKLKSEEFTKQKT